jgi:flagellar FliL protein
MASKPAKPAAPAAPAEGAPAPAKSNKLLIIVIGLLVLIVGGGAGWYFTQSKAPAEKHATETPKPELEPKFIPLGEKFTVNLQREEGDQYLQAGITLKVLDPALELKIKAAMPEIRSRLLFLLSSKKPSELVSSQGKTILVEQVIAEVDGILGFKSEAPAAPAEALAPAAHGDAAHGESAPAATAPAAPKEPKTTGVVDVLFSDFIIQ